MCISIMLPHCFLALVVQPLYHIVLFSLIGNWYLIEPGLEIRDEYAFAYPHVYYSILQK